QLPEAGANARGRPLVNWMPLEAGETVQAVQPVREYREDQYVFFATRRGTVKKTPLTEFAFRLARGKIAINLEDGDALVGAELTDGSRDIMLFASNGKAVRFDESAVRAMGRTATGVRGIRLADGESVVSLIVADPADSAEEFEGDEEAVATEGVEQVEGERAGEPDAYVLTATANGYGKRTRLSEYPRKGRGT